MSEENEWLTRRQRIDPRLRDAGWAVSKLGQGSLSGSTNAQAVVEYPTSNGPADYAMWNDGRWLAVAEAKKLTVGPAGVLTQAERYSRGADDSPSTYREGFRVPFLYSTNGEVTYFHDVRDKLNRSRTVDGFHTPTALAEMLERDTEAELAFLAALPNNNQRLRPYQVGASVAVEQAIAERKRQMLVAMATGTGKTFTLVNQVYRLMKSKTARRILFLVDRKALAAQAVQAFSAWEPEPGMKFNKLYEVYSQRFQRSETDDGKAFDHTVLPEQYLTDPQPGSAFVYVCTVQRMMINLF